jgi:hypothetical protein
VLAAESYYVAKNGVDTNPGTLQQPWLTIQHAANVATPGSTAEAKGWGSARHCGLWNIGYRFDANGQPRD